MSGWRDLKRGISRLHVLILVAVLAVSVLSAYFILQKESGIAKLAYVAGAEQSLTAGSLSKAITIQRQDADGKALALGSTIVILESTSENSTFYSDAGVTPATSVTIENGEENVSFWYRDSLLGSPTLNSSASGLSSATTSLTIVASSLDHFSVTTISNPQTAGTYFTIAVTALDQYGNTITDYNGSNTLSDTTGSITPSVTESFTNGVWTGSIAILKACANDVISTHGSSMSGISNVFVVEPSVLDHFSISSIANSQIAGVAFNITITAQDAYENIVTNYSDVNSLNDLSGSFSPRNTSAFSSGVWKGSITLFQPISDDVVFTSGSNKTGTNNAFNVTESSPPTFGTMTANATKTGQPVEITCVVNGACNLSSYMYSWNNTGTWENQTAVLFSSFVNSTAANAFLVGTWNNTGGNTVSIILYANDTSNSWSKSTQFNFTLVTPTESTEASENWAGYVVQSDIQNPQPTVTSVGASWAVPSVAFSLGATYSSEWIGISGFSSFDSTLIQVGTEQDCIGGQAFYAVWYELLPNSAITVNLNISPGDQINASIILSNSNLNQWLISISDLITGQQFQKYAYYASSRLSAEWIVERPVVGNRIASLADFGNITITNCQTTINSEMGAINSFPNVEILMYQSVVRGIGVTQLAAVSDLSSDGLSFDVTYVSAH